MQKKNLSAPFKLAGAERFQVVLAVSGSAKALRRGPDPDTIPGVRL